MSHWERVTKTVTLEHAPTDTKRYLKYKFNFCEIQISYNFIGEEENVRDNFP